MNVLAKSVMNIARACITRSIQGSKSNLTKFYENSYFQGNILNATRICMNTALQEIDDLTLNKKVRNCGCKERKNH